MKKIAVVILLLIFPFILGGCFFAADTSKVMDYNYNTIVSIQMFSINTSSGATLSEEDSLLFYEGASKLDFVMNSSYDVEEGIDYDYYFVTHYVIGFFEYVEIFVLYDNLFYNQYNKRTLGTDQQFVNLTEQIFDRAWQSKVSEVWDEFFKKR